MIMKNFKVFAMSLLAAGAFSLASCSSSDELGSDTNKSEVSGTQYVTVKIVTNGGAGSRADEPYNPGDVNSYVDGTEAESKINSIRFYLFDKDGNPYLFTNGQSGSLAYNYVDKSISNTSNSDHSNATIEGETAAVIVMNGTTTSSPEQIVAVANPDAQKLGEESLTLTKLSEKMNAFGGTETGKFVMSNSVYADNGKTVNATNISGFVEESDSEALDKPVTIYIERVMAKVNTTFGSNFNADTHKYNIKVGTVNKDGVSTDVFAVVKGWCVADEAPESYLIKQITPTWNYSWGWNNPTYHRSFWATSATYEAAINHSFKDISQNFSALYTQENTSEVATTPSTKVLVIAELQDEGGTVVPICKIGGTEYVGEQNVRNVVLNALKNKGYYTKTTENKYETLGSDDIKIVRISGDKYRCKYELAANVVVYKQNGSEWEDKSTDANADMAAMPVEIRTGGATYYYADIQPTGYPIGVVRNHYYDITINSIAGFGTAIYDKDEKIDPTKPVEDKKTYLAAQCKVLSWRIMSQSVDLK